MYSTFDCISSGSGIISTPRDTWSCSNALRKQLVRLIVRDGIMVPRQYIARIYFARNERRAKRVFSSSTCRITNATQRIGNRISFVRSSAFPTETTCCSPTNSKVDGEQRIRKAGGVRVLITPTDARYGEHETLR